MSKMSATVGTNDFGPSPVCIWHAGDGPFDLIIKAGPSTVAIKLVLRSIKRLITLSTDIRSRSFVVCILTDKRTLSAFLYDYSFFLWCKFVIAHYVLSFMRSNKI